MTIKPFKIGFAPTRRGKSDTAIAGRYRNLILEKIKQFDVEIVDIDWLNEEGLLYDYHQVEKVADRFKAEKIDGLFLAYTNFGCEEATGKLAKLLNCPVLLWGPRDDIPEKDGMRLRDTQCGLFAASKMLSRHEIPFTYIVNSWIDDQVFETGFKRFIGAASGANAFKNLRIGQIGPRPKPFQTMMCNEAELLETFQLEVVPVTLFEIVERVRATIVDEKELVSDGVQKIKSMIEIDRCSDEALQKMVALKSVLGDWAKNEKLGSIALQCWSALQDAIGIVPCLINGLLTAEGIPVSCETDIHSAATAVMMQAATRRASPLFLGELTIRHPQNDNAELLWHCGNYPFDLKNQNSPTSCCSTHYKMEGDIPGEGEFEIKGGPITIARLDGDHGKYSMLIGEVKAVPGPLSRGTYVWIETSDWPMWEDHLIRGPYIHHCVGVHGNYAAELHEACRYIPGLEPDPVEPTAAQIRSSWLR